MKRCALLLLGGAVAAAVVMTHRSQAPGRPGAAMGSPAPAAVGGPSPAPVIRGFARAVLAYDWRAGPAGQLAAVRRWATPSLVTAMASSPGAPFADRQRRTRREVDTVGAVTVAVEDRTAAAVGCAVSAPVTITAAASPTLVVRRYLDVEVVGGPAGWRVATVRP